MARSLRGRAARSIQMPLDDELTTQVAANTADITTLTRSVHQLTESIAQVNQTMNAGFDKLHSRISESTKLQWGPLGTWTAVAVSVVLAIGGLVNFGLYRSIDATSGMLNTFLTAYIPREFDMEYRRGAKDKEVESTKAMVEKLRADLDDKITDRWNVLDARILSSQKNYEVLTNVVVDFRNKAMPDIAALFERVRALENRGDR